jgi:hypothetical protein
MKKVIYGIIALSMIIALIGGISPIQAYAASIGGGDYNCTTKINSCTTTLLSDDSIALGESVTDTATVTGNGIITPTGTITFQVSSNGGYTFVQYGERKTLVNGIAKSDLRKPSAPGTYYFRAVYSGDTKYNWSQSGKLDEKLVVTKYTRIGSITTTKLSAFTITQGESITDIATVTGNGTTPPTGTITFKVSYNGGYTFTQYGTIKTLDNGSVTSDSYKPNASGTLYFRAEYSGDSTYLCSKSGIKDEPLIVNKIIKLGSTTTTVLSAASITLGGTVTDIATVIPTGSATPPTGTITFQVSTNGGYTFTRYCPIKTLDNNGSATSDPYKPFYPGTYYFRAVYSGDAKYLSSKSGIKDEPLTVTKYNRISSTTTTKLSADTITLGGSVTDIATVAGTTTKCPAPSLTGTVTFEVSYGSASGPFIPYGDPDPLDPQGPPAPKVLVNGTATSDQYTPDVSGTYYFRAHYSGDANYSESWSGNEEEKLEVICAWKLPTDPITIQKLTTDIEGLYYVNIELSQIGNNFSIHDNEIYGGWCANGYKGIDFEGTYDNTFVYSSLHLDNSNTPEYILNWKDDSGVLWPIRWDMVNYILNHHEPDTNSEDLEIAILVIINRIDINLLNDYPIAQALAQDALDNGNGFTPGPGQLGAVILDPGESYQPLFIELVVPTQCIR